MSIFNFFGKKKKKQPQKTSVGYSSGYPNRNQQDDLLSPTNPLNPLSPFSIYNQDDPQQNSPPGPAIDSYGGGDFGGAGASGSWDSGNSSSDSSSSCDSGSYSDSGSSDSGSSSSD